MKKSILLVLALIIAVCFNSIAYADSSTYNKTYLIESAIKHSPYIKDLDNQVTMLEREYRNSIVNSRELGHYLDADDRLMRLSRSGNLSDEEKIELQILDKVLGKYMNEEDRYNTSLAKEITPLNLNYSIEVTKQMKRTNINKLVLTVEQYMNNLIRVNNSILYQRQLLDNLNKNYQKLLAKKKLGLASEYDVKTMSYNISKTQIELNKLYTNKKIMLLNLYKLTGVQIDESQIVSNEIKPSDIKLDALEEYIKIAIQSRNDIKTAELYLEMKNKEFEVTKQAYFFDTNLEHKNALLGLDEAKYELDKAKADMQVQVLNAYNSLSNQINNVQKAKYSLEVAERNYKDALAKAKLGKSSDSQLATANITYTQSRIAYENAIRDAWYFKLNMDDICGTDLYASNKEG